MSYKWIIPEGGRISRCAGNECHHLRPCANYHQPCPHIDKVAGSLGFVRIPVLILLSYYEQIKDYSETRNS